MTSTLILERLTGLPLGPLRYFDSIGSTNEEAARWAETRAPHLSLVVADEQTAGRGRQGRRWYTPPGSALAFSLVLQPEEILRFAQNERERPARYVKREKTRTVGDGEVSPLIPRLTGVASLAVCSALESEYDLQPLIKWPNDVLLGGRKACGVLPELSWQGDALQAAILGIGINIAPGSLPPPAHLLFPATCLEAELGRKIDRWEVLRLVLSALLGWLSRLASPDFMQAWDSRLAYREELVHLRGVDSEEIAGRLLGLDSSGCLRLELPSGEVVAFQSGELSLRPVPGKPE